MPLRNFGSHTAKRTACSDASERAYRRSAPVHCGRRLWPVSSTLVSSDSKTTELHRYASLRLEGSQEMLAAASYAHAGLAITLASLLFVAPSHAFSPVGSVGSAAVRASNSPFASKPGVRFGLGLNPKARRVAHASTSMTASAPPSQSSGLGWDSHQVYTLREFVTTSGRHITAYSSASSPGFVKSYWLLAVHSSHNTTPTETSSHPGERSPQ